MSELERNITFANFSPEEHSVYEIGGDVIPQMAEVFGHNLTDEPDAENLGELMGAIGPAKTLQDNIEIVQRRLGTSADAIDLARGWVEKTGLILPVNRAFLDVDKAVPNGSDIYVITGGMANWMHRRADTLITEINRVGLEIGRVVLAGGNRQMRDSERDDVKAKKMESIYMKEVIKPKLEKAGVAVDAVIGIGSGEGSYIAEQAIQLCTSPKTDTVTVVSNAGVWPQNAGQIGRAMMKNDIDPARLYVISDEFPLGTGKEPASTHQNPFSILRQIAGNAREFVKHQP